MVVLALALGVARGAGPEALDETIRLVQERYGDVISADELYKAAMDGVARHLDDVVGADGSRVMSRAEFASLDAWKRGVRDGIGVEFSVAPGQGLAITDVFDGSPAHRSGVEPGDLVVGVDGTPFTGLDAAAIHRAVQQATGATVTLSIDRHGAPLRLEVARGRYTIAPVRLLTEWDLPNIRIQFFGDGAATRLAAILRQVQSAPAIVIDLRDNQGGEIAEMVAMADLLLDEGSVVLYQDRANGRTDKLLATRPAVYEGQVVLLVNEGTRGIAEAFAAALRDHGRAVLVGTTTAGMATTYSHYDLGGDMVLQLADVGLRAPGGPSWAAVGLSPDVIVAPLAVTLPGGGGKIPPDLQRDAAIQLIRADGAALPR